MKKLAIFAVLFLVVFWGCQKNYSKKVLRKNDKPVAKAYDKYLYMSDLRAVIPDGISEDDSSLYAEHYINNWVEEQLMAHLAQQYIPPQDLDAINKKVEEYRNALLITAFRNQLVRKKLDTNVSLDLISEYYERNKNNFILREPVIRGFWLRVPIDAQDMGEIRDLAMSNDVEDVNKLRSLVLKDNGTFDDFRTDWRYFSEIMAKTPYTISDPVYFLKTQKFIQTQDDDYYYFVKIYEYRLKGDYVPLTLCQEDIRRTILNHRIEVLSKEIEKRLYDDAVSKGDVKIFQ